MRGFAKRTEDEQAAILETTDAMCVMSTEALLLVRDAARLFLKIEKNNARRDRDRARRAARKQGGRRG